jgi:hypothetical protein
MKNRRGPITIGIILLLVGGFMLLDQFIPGLFQSIFGAWLSWPWIIVGTGIIFLFAAIISGVSGLAIPASIITTVGLILNYQWITGDWESWAFMWALIPASVGLGMILMGLIQGRIRTTWPGFWMLICNLIVFAVFMAFFRRDSLLLARYWPVLLIVLGVMVLARGLWPKRV